MFWPNTIHDRFLQIRKMLSNNKQLSSMFADLERNHKDRATLDEGYRMLIDNQVKLRGELLRAADVLHIKLSETQDSVQLATLELHVCLLRMFAPRCTHRCEIMRTVAKLRDKFVSANNVSVIANLQKNAIVSSLSSDAQNELFAAMMYIYPRISAVDTIEAILVEKGAEYAFDKFLVLLDYFLQYNYLNEMTNRANQYPAYYVAMQAFIDA
jgi:hypothetical protein